MPESLSFPFMKLPSDIRRIIWKLCLPDRIFECHIPYKGKFTSYCQWLGTYRADSSAPVLARVCQESRTIAFEDVDLEEYHDEDECRWLSRRDIVFQYWEPMDTEDVWDWQIDLTDDLEPYATRCKGVGVVVDRLLQPYCEIPPDVERDWEEDPDADPLQEMNLCWVGVEVVAIHTTPELAAESGLFGLLCDAPVQVVDVMDTDTISKYRDLWAASCPRDEEAAGFFDMESLPKRVQQWCSKVETNWVFHMWWTAWCKDPREDLEPARIWTATENGEGFKEGVRPNSPRDIFSRYFRETDPWAMGLVPNKDHPFVRDTIVEMPRFRPGIVFRYCKRHCHTASRDAMGSRS